MDRFAWSDTLSTGNEMIDRDHQHLIALLNQLQEAMSQGKGRTVLGGVLNELISYTIEHFGREEALMQKMHYADYIMHKSEHERLIGEVKALQGRLEAGSVALSSATYTFLVDWLNTHIKTIDKKLAEAARKRFG